MQLRVGFVMGTGRLEAFSDGVLAVAITLLVLDLHVDEASADGLGRQLVQEWPSCLGYGVSFFVLGIIWVNHHALLSFTRTVDRRLLFYGATSEGMAVSFTLMLRHILRHQLSVRPVGPAERRQHLVRFGFGSVVYPLATIVGLFSIPAMLVCYLLINGFYMIEHTPDPSG
jgi:uncharacterized membrane protein